MLPIAVDAMGGDRAPDAILDGVALAVDAAVDVVVVGPPELGQHPVVRDRNITVIPASEIIAMDEEPGGAVRTKKDSTLVRAAEAVRDGAAAAMVSAGNTGATMAAALLRMGRITKVKRPAIATPIPMPGSTPGILLDAGANAEVQPEWLVQFAQMGAVYATERFAIAEPRVGLLSIGEEPGKGDTLRKATYGLLEHASGVNFVGNVEGRDIMSANVDVIVTDGFTGNVALKALEGGMKAVTGALVAAFASSPEYKAHADALMPALAPLYEILSPDTYGGAILLGVDGVCVISHGSSGATAMRNAIGVARDMVDHDIVDKLRRAVA